MKKAVSFILLFLILCLSCCTVNAERKTVEKDRYYLGAMRVVKCKDYVSLRDAPDKTATVLAKVPLDSVVLYCNNNVAKYAAGKYKKQANLYIRCEYDGMEGYILKKYLTPAPEAEPAETRAFNKIMSREEITGGGTIALDWKEFNVAVLAAYEVIPEGDANWEYLRVGCFIDDQPIWGYTEGVKQTGQYQNLRAFMGGTEDEPQVYVYDAQYGLIMLDLMENADPEKQEEFIRNIRFSLTKMEWLVGALLKMAKIDAKAVKFNKKQVAVSELVKEVKSSVAILLDVNNQSIEQRSDAHICCDIRWTTEALTNIVKNAIEHSPSGSCLSIDCGENPLYDWISVKDCGLGLDRSSYLSIFKRFEYSTNENGFGIGMPLALKIVKGQGGDIDVDFGGGGEGATFTIKFFK